jgi:hypothetical protein
MSSTDSAIFIDAKVYDENSVEIFSINNYAHGTFPVQIIGNNGTVLGTIDKYSNNFALRWKKGYFRFLQCIRYKFTYCCLCLCIFRFRRRDFLYYFSSLQRLIIFYLTLIVKN